jgi:hypothetical protein
MKKKYIFFYQNCFFLIHVFFFIKINYQQQCPLNKKQQQSNLKIRKKTITI